MKARKATGRLTRMRIHAVGLVKAGANQRDFALVRKENETMNPTMKASLIALLAGLGEKATTLCDTIKTVADDPAANALPPDIAAQLAALEDAFDQGLAPFVPDAPDETMMTAGDVAQAEPDVAQAMALVEKAKKLCASKKGGKLVKSIEGQLPAVEAAVVAMGAQLATAKSAFVAKAQPKLAIKQWMGLYTTGFQRFFALLMELMPFLEAVEEAGGGEGPASSPMPAAAPPTMEMALAKALDGRFDGFGAKVQAAVEATGKTVSDAVTKAVDPVLTRVATLEATLEKLSKARLGSLGNDDDLPAERPNGRKYGPGADISAEIERKRRQAPQGS